MPLHERLRGRDVEAPVRQFADAAPVRLQPGLEIERAVLVLHDQRWRVARGEEIDAVVIRVEELCGVEPGGGRERASPRAHRVVRQVRRVPGVAVDHVVPAGVARRRGEHHHLLQVIERHRRLLRGERQRPVWNLRPHREPPRPPAVERLHERELHRCLEPRGNRWDVLQQDLAFDPGGLPRAGDPAACHQRARPEEQRSERLSPGRPKPRVCFTHSGFPPCEPEPAARPETDRALS